MKRLTLFSLAAVLAVGAAAQSIVGGDRGGRPLYDLHATPVADIPFRVLVRSMPDDWYKTKDARMVADSVMAYQFPSGGWTKNHSWHQAEPTKAQERAEIRHHIKTDGKGSTIDNTATTMEMTYLAKMYKATGKKVYRKAFMRGVDYLITMQYPNGGWPQFYPRRSDRLDNVADYSHHITFNDEAMVNVMRVIRDVFQEKAPFDGLKLTAAEKARLEEAFDKGVQCILNTQIRRDGKPTVWCQQHHYETLEPVGARSYELPSFTGCGETVDIIDLLMSLPDPSDEVVAAVTGAVEWLEKHAITNMRMTTVRTPDGKRDRRVVYEEGSPALWARFYDLETEEPYFCDRDGVKRKSLNDIGAERRNGYRWLGDDPKQVIERYPAWITSVRPGNYQTGDYGYLYCHMNGMGPAWTAYALSRDGFHYHDLLNGDSIFSDAVMTPVEGRGRDAYICRKHDGTGYLMVLTDLDASDRSMRRLGKGEKWENYAISLLHSDDLIHWESKSFDFRQGPSIFCDPEAPSVYKDWSKVMRVWAPQVMWDNSYTWPDGRKGGYMVYYSMLNRAEEGYDRIYYSYADESFTQLTQPRLLIDWGYATIDTDINWVAADSSWHLMIKKEGGTPGLFTATAKSLTGPWSLPVDDDYVSFEGKKKCEGVSAFQLAGDSTWVIGYIEYSTHTYRMCLADEHMRNFRDPRNIEGVNRPQHGSFLRLTKEEYDRLQAWSDAYEREHMAADRENPVIVGLHADPEALYSEATGRYYIYPTTDGAEGWRSHDFRVFSSTDLRTWADEGVIFDLQGDCAWADWYAWAPCIIERKEGKGYKYYFYYVAEGKIGVAVADAPTGPFRDALGRPLLSSVPEGVKGGQVIDPDVFRDPASGKYYLYWGNGFLACSELGDDMTSIRETKVLISREDKRKFSYNEGVYVFARPDAKGRMLYYFMWSENDTRSKSYRVRYAISDSPTALVRDGQPVAAAERDIVLQRSDADRIFGTGHHAVLQLRDAKGKPKDEWRIVYHRFQRPDAEKRDWSAGFYREVCIDPLEFNADGTIKPVKPSL